MLITLLLHVAITVPHSFSPAVARIAVAEAADIWVPYGVTIDLAGPCGWASDQSTVLNLVAAEGNPAGRRESWAFGAGQWQRPLGAITFAPDGTPAPTITVFVGDLIELVSRSHVLGADQARWPRKLHDLILGRALGRVLAHEVGHFLLRTRQHTAAGLMRSVQRAGDLVEPSRRGFTLSPVETARVR
jgi:hypothetical protein